MPTAPAVPGSSPRSRTARRSVRHLAGAAAGALAGALVAAAALAPAAARAQPWALTMSGALDARSSLVSGGSATPLAAGTPFTLHAVFSTAQPSLVAPIGVPGFVAYAPSLMELTFGGRTYAVQPFSAATPTGVAVSIFDDTTPFGPPGRYGVGFIQDPLADGAGIIADFLGASPGFRIGAGGLATTTFTGYAGVGVSSGVCLEGPPANCRRHAVTPIPLTWQGQAFALSLGSYEQTGGPTFTATLTAVPEPATVALVGAGLAAAGAAARRRRPTPVA